MVKGYNALEGTQTDINRRILRRLDALEAESAQVYDDTEIKERVTSLENRIEAIENSNLHEAQQE